MADLSAEGAISAHHDPQPLSLESGRGQTPRAEETGQPASYPLSPAGQEWAERGACRTSDPQLFFPPEDLGAAHKRRLERAAKKLCARCPVRRDCLAHALNAGERHGIWGGLTPQERASTPQ